jgi:hypothetical protein
MNRPPAASLPQKPDISAMLPKDCPTMTSHAMNFGKVGIRLTQVAPISSMRAWWKNNTPKNLRELEAKFGTDETRPQSSHAKPQPVGST